MHRFKELKVWQRSVEQAVIIYSHTITFPAKEQFGLVSQINRSVVSVASNIAEGAGRESVKEFSHFLTIALGSLFELETQLIIANKIGYIHELKLSELTSEINEIQNMIVGLKKSLT